MILLIDKDPISADSIAYYLQAAGYQVETMFDAHQALERAAALDPELVGEVLDVIKTLAKEGMTMIVVSHELAFARDVANRVLFMDEGRVVEQGPPDQVLVNPTTERAHRFLRLMGDVR